MVSLGKPI
jgi:hypothetical protein